MTSMPAETGKRRFTMADRPAKHPSPLVHPEGHAATMAAMRTFCESTPRTAARPRRTSRAACPLAHGSGHAVPGAISIAPGPSRDVLATRCSSAPAPATPSVAGRFLGFRRAALEGL